MPPPHDEATVITAALQHLHACLHPAVLHHSHRVHKIAEHLAEPTIDLAALQIAALFHDSGTTHTHDGPDRFEVEGAHAAARFLETHGWNTTRIKPVWDAIALHTSPGIAENAGPLPALIRTAVLNDFGTPHPHITPRFQADLEQQHPRHAIERILATLIIEQTRTAPDPTRKAPPSSWPGQLLAGEAHTDPTTGTNPNF